jgi:hypothetical protein
LLLPFAFCFCLCFRLLLFAFAFAFAFTFAFCLYLCLCLLSSPKTAEPALSGLKACATLAWGNAPGPNRLPLGGLKARAKCLIRNFNETTCGDLAPPKVSH